MLIDARLIRQKVLIHREGRFNRPMQQNLFLNVCRHHGIDRLSVIFLAGNSSCVALRGRLRSAARLVVRGVDVVLARWEDVRVLGLCGKTRRLYSCVVETRSLTHTQKEAGPRRKNDVEENTAEGKIAP